MRSSSRECSYQSSLQCHCPTANIVKGVRYLINGLQSARGVSACRDYDVVILQYFLAWRTSFAPMFSTGSSSSTSLATVTPSLTILGDPNLDSSTTFLPCTQLSFLCLGSDSLQSNGRYEHVSKLAIGEFTMCHLFEAPYRLCRTILNVSSIALL